MLFDPYNIGGSGVSPKIAGKVFSFAKFNRISPKSDTKLL